MVFGKTQKWCPFATRTRAGRFADAPFNSTSNAKLLWHTTEGASCSGAIRTYNSNGYAPHFTIDPYTGELHQHYPVDSRATTLADGAHSVNREATIQVEVVGTCDRSASWAGPESKWYVGNWNDQAYKTLAKLALWVEQQCGVRRRVGATFRPYPSSYGFSASQRLTWAQYVAAAGHIGHQHAPFNSHGDPGVMDFAHLFTAMGGGTVPAVAPTDLPVRQINLTPFNSAFSLDTAPTAKAPSHPVAVKYGQTALNKVGVANLDVDGWYGPGTRAAVRAWQVKQGMKTPSGVLTPEQWYALSKASGVFTYPDPSPNPVVVTGVQPPNRRAVAYLQRALNRALGVECHGAFYDAKTYAAVKKYQAKLGHPQTGVPTFTEWQALARFTGEFIPTK